MHSLVHIRMSTSSSTVRKNFVLLLLHIEDIFILRVIFNSWFIDKHDEPYIKLYKTYDISKRTVEIFSGEENRVSSSRKYFTIYSCNFDLMLYPFDIQECYMNLQILSASNEYLHFNLQGIVGYCLSKTVAMQDMYGRIGKVVASHAEGCKGARSNPGCGLAAPIYTMHEALRGHC